MIKRIAISLALFLTVSGMLHAAVQLKYAVIVHPDHLTGWEKDAVTDMQTALSRITGKDFRCYPESQAPAEGVKIFIGATKAAASNGIDIRQLEPQEFQLKTTPSAVFIAGGTPTGTSYGVSTFLQDYFGVYQLDWDCFVFPENPAPAISELNLRQKPDIPFRDIYNMLLSTRLIPKAKSSWHQYYRRNRIEWKTEDQITPGFRLSSQTRACHNFFQYVPPKKYFKDHPEYFSMRENNKRSWFPTGQLCLSNREMRKIALKSLLEFIRKDRTRYPENPPTVYDFSQEDNTYYLCRCPDCSKITEQYGGESALLLDFINEIATEIKKTYPDILIRTFAYTCTEKPVKGLKIADNVIVRYCDLYGFSNHMYPLTDAVNSSRRELFQNWMKLNPRLALWDYILMMPGQPMTAVDSIIGDARFFKKAGLQQIFVETEYKFMKYYTPQTFHILQYFLQAQLLFDSSQDENKLIEIFMKNYYGAAAPEMTAYLNLLLRSQRTYRTPQDKWIIHLLSHIRKDFLLEARALINRGRAKVKNDKTVSGRVSRELINVDFALMKFYRSNEHLKKEYQQYQDEYRSAVLEHLATFPMIEPVRRGLLKKLDEELSVSEMKFTDLPKEISDLPENRYLILPYIYQTYYLHGKQVRDPESTQPLSLCWIPSVHRKHRLPVSVGVYGKVSKKCRQIHITHAEDEKYHWYKIGEFELDQQSHIFALDWHIGMELKDFHTLADGYDFNPNKYDIWVSVRLQGPAYVPGSTRPDGFFMDRAVLVRKY